MAEVNLDHWRGHLEAIEREGISVARYARKHNLSKHSLYMARRVLRQQQEKGIATPHQQQAVTAFVPVRLSQTEEVQVVARLPNGVELRFGTADLSVLQWLAGL